MTTTADDADRELSRARWDLAPLLGQPRDGDAGARVAQLLEEARIRGRVLTDRYRGCVARVAAEEFADLLSELAAIRELATRAETFAELRWSVDTADQPIGALRQFAQDRVAEINVALLFFNSEWAALDDDHADSLLAQTSEDPRVPSQYLRRLRARRAFMLPDGEERVLAAVSPTSRDAWRRQYIELGSAVQVDLGGELVPVDTALTSLQDPDRAVRRAAGTALRAALAGSMPAKAFVLNTLLQEKAVNDRLRGYPHWLASRNLENETSDESVRALVDAVTQAGETARDWYVLKARLLGVDRLADYDRFAPLRPSGGSVSYAMARASVTTAFEGFSPRAGAVAREAFEDGWIDAPPGGSKTGGAFCSDGVPSVHPYVLLNFNAARSDVLYLAHELGHALHAALARPRGIFEIEPALVTAETASIFAETLVFERMLGDADRAGQLDLLAWQLDSMVQTLFEPIAIHHFEQRIHAHRRAEGELSTDTLSELWLRSQTDIYGDSFQMTFNEVSWARYPHMAIEPGYVYAYAYGHLLALSAYARYRDRGPGFAEHLLEMLAAGSSRPPSELATMIGIDVADPHFWDAGLQLVAAQLHRAESLAADHSATGPTDPLKAPDQGGRLA